MKLVSVMVAACALVAASGAQAQRAVVTRVASVKVARKLDERLSTAAGLVSRGRSDSVATFLRAELDTVATLLRTGLDSAEAQSRMLDSIRREDVLVSVVSNTSLASSPVLLTVLLPSDSGPVRPLPTTLSGHTTLHHLYLTSHRHEDIAMEWLVSREESPLVNDLNFLLTAATRGAGMYAELAARAGQDPSFVALAFPPPTAADSVYIKVDRIDDLHRRASLSFAMRTSVRTVDAAEITQGLAAIGRDPQLQLATAGSRCADTVQQSLVRVARARLEGESKSKTFNELHAELRTEMAAVVSSAPCTAGSSPRTITGDDRALAERVLARMIELTSPSPRTTESKGTLRNVPRQWVHIGTVLGVAAGSPRGDNFERVDDKIDFRPVEGLLTSAVVHVHLPRDPDAPISALPWWPLWHRLSGFGGVVVLPREGLTAGASFALWRGLGVQLSHAWLRANRLPNGVTSESLPSSSTAPFRPHLVGHGRWSVGLSIALQR